MWNRILISCCIILNFSDFPKTLYYGSSLKPMLRRVVSRFLSTIIHKIFETNSSFHVKKTHYEKSFISIFQEYFNSFNKIFVLARRLVTRLWDFEIFLIFPDFLGSWVLVRSAACDAIGACHFYCYYIPCLLHFEFFLIFPYFLGS